MNCKQIELALLLLRSLEHDTDACTEAADYGNWIEHLQDHVSDLGGND